MSSASSLSTAVLVWSPAENSDGSWPWPAAIPGAALVESLLVVAARPLPEPFVETLDALRYRLPNLRALEVSLRPLSLEGWADGISDLAVQASSRGIALTVSFWLDSLVLDTGDAGWSITPGVRERAAQWQTARITVTSRAILTARNLWWADDMWWWSVAHGLPCRFALWLHPASWSVEQKFHVAMFFDKLAVTTPVALQERAFYRAMSNALLSPPVDLSGGRRYRWQIMGAGDSEALANRAFPNTPAEFYSWRSAGFALDKDSLAQSWADGRASWEVLYRRALHKLGGAGRSVASVPAPRPAACESLGGWRRVLIVGWWGTETTGDKAIFGELFHFLRAYTPGADIIISTLDQRVSDQTLIELGEKVQQTVPLSQCQRPGLIESVDAVIVSGGPLAITATEHIWRVFREAERQGKARIIFGCGIDPPPPGRLHSIVAEVCRLATSGFFRDAQSLEWAKTVGAAGRLDAACDPAFAYVRRWAKHSHLKPPQRDRPQVIGLLRANTTKFTGWSRAKLSTHQSHFAQAIAQVLDQFCSATGGQARLLAMHALWNGGDDREFNRSVVQARPGRLTLERRYLPLDETLTAIAQADLGLAMRFHGHVICAALGQPFLSINYTGASGKVENLVQRLDYEKYSLVWQDIEAQTSIDLTAIWRERSYLSRHLSDRVDMALARLGEIYEQIFDIDAAGVRDLARPMEE